MFGFELLQLGAWGPTQHLLAGARTQHKSLLAPSLSPGVTLCAPLASLPFAADSIDAVLLPHTLELVEDPYAVLREAGQVLVAEGCLMICRLQPHESGWGARRLFARSFGRRAFSATDPAHVVGEPPARLDGASGFRSGQRLRLLRLPAGDAPTPKIARRHPLRQAEYRERRPLLTAGAYLLKARKRVQTLSAGAAAAPRAAAGAGTGDGVQHQGGLAEEVEP